MGVATVLPSRDLSHLVYSFVPCELHGDVLFCDVVQGASHFYPGCMPSSTWAATQLTHRHDDVCRYFQSKVKFTTRAALSECARVPGARDLLG